MPTRTIEINPHDFGLRWRSLIALAVALALIAPLFSLPRPVNVSSIPWKAELLFSVCLLAGSIVVCQRSGSASTPRQLWFITLWVVLIGGWSAVSSFWAISWFAALHHALVWLNYAVVLVIAYRLIADCRRSDLIFRTLVLIALIIGALAAFDFLTIVDFSYQEGTIRIRYAKFAELLVTIAPVLFAAAVYRKSFWRVLAALVPGAVAWAAAMLSLSKGAFIAGVIGFAFFFASAALFSNGVFRKRVGIAFAFWLMLTLAFQFGSSGFSEIPSTAEYISGTADESRSTSTMRIFTWKVSWEMVKQHPFFGVGADNFGLAFNASRVSFSASEPNDAGNELGEDYIFERAHNEPLQLLAELGLFGFLAFLMFGCSIAFVVIRTVRSNRGRCSPIFLAAVSGCIAFGVSSMVSSFSFRAFQNGVVFFAVLGIAFAVSPAKQRLSDAAGFEKTGVKLSKGALCTATAIAVGLLVLYSFSKGLGNYSAYFAERAGSVEGSQRLFNTSLFFDPDLSGSYLALAGQAEKRKDWNTAAENYRRAIDGGLGISQIYSFLADAQEKNGESLKAVASLREGVAIFPRSVFLRARLSQTLRNDGQIADSEKEMDLARTIDLRQANGWNAVLTEGILKAHLRSQTDNTYAKPYELLPVGAITFYAGGIDQLSNASP